MKTYLRKRHDKQVRQIAATLLMLVAMISANAVFSKGKSHLEDERPLPSKRARDLGITPGEFPTGPLNAISDVQGVRVGHVTLIEGDSVRTGVTAILPHGANIFQNKVPAGIFVANGYGKLAGSTQLVELGEIETPIILTNTLSVASGIAGVVEWTLLQPGNENVRSVNAIVGETNDGLLNDIRRRVVSSSHVRRAIEVANSGPVEEGSVGAGTGTTALGWKGGIGTSSRRIEVIGTQYTIGVLVQSNFGGNLSNSKYFKSADSQNYLEPQGGEDGSIIIVIATDAPLSDRNLRRLAFRAMAGLARTGANFSNGSGDYAVAFSTAIDVRRTLTRRTSISHIAEMPNDEVTDLFVAVAEATEEAIYNSLLMSRSSRRL